MLWSDGSGEVTSSSYVQIRSYLHRLQVAHSLLFTLYPTKLSIHSTPNLHSQHCLFTSKVFRDRKTTPQTQDLNRHRHIHIYNVLHDATIAHQIVFIIPAQQFNQIISIIIIILVVVGVALC